MDKVLFASRKRIWPVNTRLTCIGYCSERYPMCSQLITDNGIPEFG